MTGPAALLDEAGYALLSALLPTGPLDEIAQSLEPWLQDAVGSRNLLAHPQCSCTPASLAELAEVLARARTRPRTYVLFLQPQGFSNDWVQSDLWKTAAAIPGVTLVRDDDSREARRFGSATSGQTLFYDGDGALRFSGGITGSRSHAGDNAGRRSLVALLSGGEPDRTATSVFGCPLFASGI